MNRREEYRVELVLVRYYNNKIWTAAAIDELDRIYGVLPDDGELATHEWMQSVCGDLHLYAGDLFLHLGKFPPIALPEMTRYQFRRLCEALGVELQEVKGE